MQTKTQSFIESIENVALGFIISYLAGFVIFPLCDVEITAGENLAATLCFTVLSVIRSYLVRRFKVNRGE